MDKTRVIKFFSRSSDISSELEKIVSIMAGEGFELLYCNIGTATEATLVFREKADACIS